MLNKKYLKQIILEEIQKLKKEGAYDEEGDTVLFDRETGESYPWCYTTKFKYKPEEAFLGIQDILTQERWNDYARKYRSVTRKSGSKERGFCIRSGHASVYMFLLRGQTFEDAVEAALQFGLLEKK